ncbi:CapA family protein [Natrialba asiatica]|uniref:Poly-gamma-glutamate synthesis protein (Capsule biosynthesis protein) n=1 Tax=Natrialba asiatica (strain ATCC 700177 / DSM 12278 / JCM 9576 / FERM P-10747 / NBRC 102637 / 172P1) TaxID=29540 RepID=M0B6I0_NATA1|nr:CapA family protein [Natrialba asiatica]ELZ05878.1 poly-gamma-glutamate synthesis protein (capsule biosynthesis protein) [Natrialba asiatica DSM 12278]
MSGCRRRFLAAAGTAVLGGCTAPVAEPAAFEDHERHDTTIGFAGDTMLGRDLNRHYGQDDVDPASVWGDLQPRLKSLDAVCCNLECCLSTRGEPFPDRTYHFRGDPEWAVPALSAGNVRFASLANNHAMDYGTVALTDTIDALEAAGIDVAGAGESPAAAREPATFSVGAVTVAVVSFADRYVGYAATDDRPGITHIKPDPANPETQQVVEEALERAQAHDPDLLVASVHWGPNWAERPSELLIAFGHWLVDQGVDLVHGHSAHVVQAIERYGNGVVLHDTGDFVDDFGTKDDLGNDQSYLFEVTLEDGRLEEIRLVPIAINDGVSRASEDEAAWLRKTMRDRSETFGTTYERDGDGLVVSL